MPADARGTAAIHNGDTAWLCNPVTEPHAQEERAVSWVKRIRDRLSPSAIPAEAEMADSPAGSWSREIFDSAREILLIMLPDGHLAAGNPAASRAFDRPADTIEHSTLRDLFRGAGSAILEDIGEQAADTGHVELEAVALRGDGTTFEVVVHGAPITHCGRAAFLIGVEDQTERQRAEEQRAVLARNVLVAQEEERSRISRDLHDGLGQIIAAAHFELGMLRKRLTATSGVDEAEFAESTALIERAGEKLRRICRGLRPPMLDDLGLIPAVRQLVDEIEEHSDLEIDLEVRHDEDQFPVPPDAALCVFRVLQEALTNVVRHSDASRVSVTLAREYQWLTLSVYDDGEGFEPSALAQARGYGVEGMKERARLVNGMFEIRSVPGQGTRVALRVPVPRQAEEESS
jgi:PAS domain S-box-containing protein